MAAAVIKHHNIRINGPGRVDHLFQTGLQPFAVQVNAHHGSPLHPDVVPQIQQIRACPGIGLGPDDGPLGDGIQKVGGDRIIGHHVHHQILHAPDVPGSFPNGALHTAHHRQPPGPDTFSLDLLMGSVPGGKIRQRVGFHFRKAVNPLKRAAHVRHMLGSLAARLMGNTPKIDNAAFF